MDKAEAPALAPAKAADEQPLLAKENAASGKVAAAPQAGAPAMMREQATGAMPRAEVKLKSAAPAERTLNAVSANNAPLVIIVQVKDVEAAAKEVEQAITRLGGSITKRDNPETKRVYVITINTQNFPELKKKLEVIGWVKDDAATPTPQDGRVELRIELVPDSALP